MGQIVGGSDIWEFQTINEYGAGFELSIVMIGGVKWFLFCIQPGMIIHNDKHTYVSAG